MKRPAVIYARAYTQCTVHWTPGQLAEALRLSFLPGMEIQYGPRKWIWDAPIVRRVQPYRVCE